MNIIKKNLAYFNILLSFCVLIIFNKELFIPKNGAVSLLAEAKNSAQERSVLIEWGSSSWSGVILSSELQKTKILTIVHEDSMEKIKENNKENLKISFNSEKKYSGKITRWNGCNELSVIEINSSIPGEFKSKIKLESKESYLSQPLFSFGHPLGLNLHYSEGYLSSVGNRIKPCGMVTNGFSGGTVPGQTGSGVWNESGELSGLIVATSAFPIKTLDREGNQVGVSVIPITFLGRFIPALDIRKFLE